MKNLMKEAHKMTKEICNKYNDVDYKTQLGLCLSYLSSKEGEKEEMINYETLEYTFVFEKAGHEITLVLKDNGKYGTPKVKGFLVDSKNYKVAAELEDPFVKEEQRRAYAIKLTKELKSLFNTKATMMRLNEESEDFVRNYTNLRKEILLKRDTKKFDRNEKMEATVINYDGRSFNVKSDNAYVKELVKNINENLGCMLKYLETFKTYEVNDAHHDTIGYELTGKDLEELSKKSLVISEEIEIEKANKLAALKEKARLEGKQLMEQWTENKRCEVIIYRKYMMPNGETRVERERTW